MNCNPNSLVGKDRTCLDTPCLVLDLDTFENNLMLMRDNARTAGKKLRPHAKTHKCSRISALQLASGNCIGICAAKLSEAEALLKSGIPDVLITSPIVSQSKIEKLVALAEAYHTLACVVDSKENALALHDAAARRRIRIDVLVDVDPEMGRTGVAFENTSCFANFVASLPGLNLRGIQCYAGHLQHIVGDSERSSKSSMLMGKAASIFRDLKASGFKLDTFTGTGTGTFASDLSIPELTDIQVGSYCVMDAEYLKIGGPGGTLRFDTFKPALTLLASVISRNHPDFVTVDAGLKQLYYTPAAPPEIIGRGPEKWRYEWFGDEHGMVAPPHGTPTPKLGEIIELVLPHCDPSINLHDCIWTTRNGKVVECWQIDLRGLGQ